MTAKDKSPDASGVPVAAQMEMQAYQVSEQAGHSTAEDASGMPSANRSTLSSHILKVPHHGSATSSHPAFIEADQADMIICWRHNWKCSGSKSMLP